MIPLLSRSLSSSLRGGITAAGTLCSGSFTSGTLLSISMLYSPSRQPSPVNTSSNSVSIFVVWSSNLSSFVTVLSYLLSMSMASIFPYCTLRNLMASLAFLLSGILVHLPSGHNLVLLYMTSTFSVRSSCVSGFGRCIGMTLQIAPQSIWKLTSLSSFLQRVVGLDCGSLSRGLRLLVLIYFCLC